jgi:hypothetical protein
MLSRARLLVLVALTACGGSRPPPATTTAVADTSRTEEPETTPTPAAPQARVRLVHAAIESRDQSVSLAADGTTSAPAAFQFASEYLVLSPGDHAISARANDAELIGASFTLAEGSSTIIAYSTGDFPVALALAPDVPADAPVNVAQIRLFHAMVGQGAIDLCAPAETARGDGSPIIANVAPGSLGAPDGSYVTVAGGSEVALQIRAQNATPCHGRPLGTVHGFAPAGSSNYTLILVGRSGRRRVAPELLFCADPPASDTSCATLGVDAG